MSKRKDKRRRFHNQQKEQRQLLNERRQREFIARIANIPPDRMLFLPLDIGKNVHWFQALTGSGRIVHPPKALTTDYEGYLYEKQHLDGWLTSGQFDLVVMGHEPTGIYHETWCRHLLHDLAAYLADGAHPQLLYRFLNPYQVKLERLKLIQRSRKTDRIDLWAMSNLLQQGQGSPAVLPDSNHAMLTQYVYFDRQATHALKAIRIDEIRQFDRIWPGAIVNVKRFKQTHPDLPVPRPIVETKPFERDTFRVLFEHCPDPYQVRALGLTGIIALLHEHEVRCGPVTAQRILDCAARALLSPREVVAVYIQGLEQLRADEAHWLARQVWAEQHLEDMVAATPARQLLTIRGLSAPWAARYLDLVGAPPVFDWPDQVWACVGFDLIEKQSGDSTKTYGISHRGDPFHRQTLVWMANLVAGHHPTFGQVFMAAESRGLGVWGAAIHTAHKLNRVCFRLLAEDRPYVDDTHAEDFTRWRSYWIAYRQYRRDPKQFDDPGPWKPSR
jgi:hypothetical protein